MALEQEKDRLESQKKIIQKYSEPPSKDGYDEGKISVSDWWNAWHAVVYEEIPYSETSIEEFKKHWEMWEEQHETMQSGGKGGEPYDTDEHDYNERSDAIWNELFTQFCTRYDRQVAKTDKETENNLLIAAKREEEAKTAETIANAPNATKNEKDDAARARKAANDAKALAQKKQISHLLIEWSQERETQKKIASGNLSIAEINREIEKTKKDLYGDENAPTHEKFPGSETNWINSELAAREISVFLDSEKMLPIEYLSRRDIASEEQDLRGKKEAGIKNIPKPSERQRLALFETRTDQELIEINRKVRIDIENDKKGLEFFSGLTDLEMYAAIQQDRKVTFYDMGGRATLDSQKFQVMQHRLKLLKLEEHRDWHPVRRMITEIDLGKPLSQEVITERAMVAEITPDEYLSQQAVAEKSPGEALSQETVTAIGNAIIHTIQTKIIRTEDAIREGVELLDDETLGPAELTVKVNKLLTLHTELEALSTSLTRDTPFDSLMNEKLTLSEDKDKETLKLVANQLDNPSSELDSAPTLLDELRKESEKIIEQLGRLEATLNDVRSKKNQLSIAERQYGLRQLRSDVPSYNLDNAITLEHLARTRDVNGVVPRLLRYTNTPPDQEEAWIVYQRLKKATPSTPEEIEKNGRQRLKLLNIILPYIKELHAVLVIQAPKVLKEAEEITSRGNGLSRHGGFKKENTLPGRLHNQMKSIIMDLDTHLPALEAEFKALKITHPDEDLNNEVAISKILKNQSTWQQYSDRRRRDRDDSNTLSVTRLADVIRDPKKMQKDAVKNFATQIDTSIQILKDRYSQLESLYKRTTEQEKLLNDSHGKDQEFEQSSLLDLQEQRLQIKREMLRTLESIAVEKQRRITAYEKYAAYVKDAPLFSVLPATKKEMKLALRQVKADTSLKELEVDREKLEKEIKETFDDHKKVSEEDFNSLEDKISKLRESIDQEVSDIHKRVRFEINKLTFEHPQRHDLNALAEQFDHLQRLQKQLTEVHKAYDSFTVKDAQKGIDSFLNRRILDLERIAYKATFNDLDGRKKVERIIRSTMTPELWRERQRDWHYHFVRKLQEKERIFKDSLSDQSEEKKDVSPTIKLKELDTDIKLWERENESDEKIRVSLAQQLTDEKEIRSKATKEVPQEHLQEMDEKIEQSRRELYDFTESMLQKAKIIESRILLKEQLETGKKHKRTVSLLNKDTSNKGVSDQISHQFIKIKLENERDECSLSTEDKTLVEKDLGAVKSYKVQTLENNGQVFNDGKGGVYVGETHNGVGLFKRPLGGGQQANQVIFRCLPDEFKIFKEELATKKVELKVGEHYKFKPGVRTEEPKKIHEQEKRTSISSR